MVVEGLSVITILYLLVLALAKKKHKIKKNKKNFFIVILPKFSLQNFKIIMKNSFVIKLFKITTFFVFTGRAYQLIFWDAPYRSLLWDQKLISPILEFFNFDWQSYAISLENDFYIQCLIQLNGVFFLICAILCVIVKSSSLKIIKTSLIFGGFLLVFLALLEAKSKSYIFTMFFEHTIQFSLPFIMLYYLKYKQLCKLITPLKVIIALTFLCHGLYALGTLLPLPASFVTITMTILGTTEETSIRLLFIAAILDFSIVIGLFITKIDKYILLYAFFWGLVTAFARTWSALIHSFSLLTFHQTFYETVFRLSHGLVPLILYYILKHKKQ